MTNDDKLKNILKLKNELEKELEKKGLKKINKKIKKEKTNDLESIKKLKEKIIKKANITKDKSFTIFDINMQDYDASIEEILNSLKTFSIDNKIYKALLFLLESKFDEVEKILKDKDIYSKYNFFLSKLYKRENISNEIVEFIKSYPQSIYPFILLLEYYLIKGTSTNFSKILSQLSKIDSFFSIILSAYRKKLDEDEVVKTTIKTKKFLPLLLYFLKAKNFEPEKTKSYCLNTNYSLINGTPPTKKEYCIKAVFANAAWSILNDYELRLDTLKKFEKTPEYNLFFGFFYFNNQIIEKSKLFFEKFEKQVERYSIKLFNRKHTHIGLKQFCYIPREYTKEVHGNLLEIVENNTEYDFFVEYYDPEIVRLLFSEKHCKLVYGG
ncbi:hypothetical protein SU69_01155 [Thermosipho melanesiensis]|uniref:Uncharacterized protein n=2 Tax=Thermosipho melanesiensis TaxID=46541 RepID=A6LJI9_THEM4|nr:hypothetical protein [Thermosipho melanesiensis]ABR30090.1 hypothetical protein Tmel_0216 [Thermosipho melanesiensis BI429]APT73287.1 hypothetical protein BW47_01195 [Thermosipho melanesiensis]OOC38679.1 hypothetical protein SU68_01155 [Thermosipho melanesiensis]OOC40483.1 hypothetical protein SU70_01155 [Thermosipho melanesiensis]OOC40748.1 hypothetical protein SU69_01155 [Thermosipho melanesiensis]